MHFNMNRTEEEAGVNRLQKIRFPFIVNSIINVMVISKILYFTFSSYRLLIYRYSVFIPTRF